jgi:predicted aspartyl protease
MGVFTVPIKVRNGQNTYLPSDRQGGEVEYLAIVDLGAVELSLPAEMVSNSSWKNLEWYKYTLLMGGEMNIGFFGIAEVEVQGRISHVRVIELPHGSEPLLGAVPLEEMDWHISPREKKLLPNPKSPEKPLLPLG